MEIRAILACAAAQMAEVQAVPRLPAFFLIINKKNKKLQAVPRLPDLFKMINK
jgi:hypothetical protein